MCEAAGRDVHLNVEVRVEGQDSPYQVAAPCWLAELTLNVNLLTMKTMMMKMMKMMMTVMMVVLMLMMMMMMKATMTMVFLVVVIVMLMFRLRPLASTALDGTSRTCLHWYGAPMIYSS